MASTSFTVKVDGLKRLAKALSSSSFASDVQEIVRSKALVAIVGQGIADNFDKEGPGWKPLKAATMNKFLTKAAKSGATKHHPTEAAHKILDSKGLLKKAATTPGADGNIYRVEGTNIVWGTSLVYAAIHNKGGTIHHPGTKNGFGMGIKIPPHDIKMPKREFLILHAEWKKQIAEMYFNLLTKKLSKLLKGEG